jgi:hypothetical protein
MEKEILSRQSEAMTESRCAPGNCTKSSDNRPLNYVGGARESKPGSFIIYNSRKRTNSGRRK